MSGQGRPGQSKAKAPGGPELNNAGLGSFLHWMLSYVDEPDEPYVWFHSLERTNSHRIAPSPTLKCCGGVKNHCAWPQREPYVRSCYPRHHEPTFLLRPSPRVPPPQLCSLTPLFLLTSGTKYSGDSSRPSSPSLFQNTLSLPPTSSTTPTQFGTTCKHGDRREGDRSVTSPSPPARLLVSIPPVQLHVSQHLTTWRNLAAPELYHGAMGTPPSLCLESRELASAPPDCLPSSIVAAPGLNGFESTSWPVWTTY